MRILSEDNEIKSQEGVHAVGLIVIRDLGWVFRDQPVSDYGIDAHVEIVAGQATGRLLGLQIKAGKSYFSEQTSKGFVFRGDYKHLDYWRNHSLPVVLVLYEPSTGECFWQAVTDDRIQYSKSAWKITVPSGQVLNSDSAEALLELVGGSPFEQGLRRLFLHKPFMDALVLGGRVILEAEEWVNKSLNRTTPEVRVLDEDGEEIFTRSWPTTYTPGLDFIDSLRVLFPWAKFAIDVDFYEEYTDENRNPWDWRYRSENSPSSSIEVDEPGSDDEVEAFWPYEENGETAQYRFDLTLNQVGTAFLTLEEFLQEPTGIFTIDDLMRSRPR